jgi:hypothetical protein
MSLLVFGQTSLAEQEWLMTRPLAIGIASLTLFVGPNISSAASYQSYGIIEQNNTLSGQPTYDFNLFFLRALSSVGDHTLEMVAPDGVRYGETVPELDTVRVRFLDLALSEVNARFAGEWIFEERVSPTIFNRYRFTIPTLAPSNFLASPIITSPSDGAKVGRVFDLAWTPGTDGGGFNIRSTKSPLTGGPTIVRRGDSLATFTYPAEGFTPFEIVALRVDQQILPREGLQITRLNSGANSSFFDILSIETHSPPIALTVVPEPQACALLLLGITASFRRRRPTQKAPPDRTNKADRCGRGLR